MQKGLKPSPDFNAISHIIIDVDGTLTDGGIYYDGTGNEYKKFCSRDGAGFLAARQVGLKLVVLTGRESFAVKRRMEEFKVDILEQHILDKKSWLTAFMREHALSGANLAYAGDDLNDLASMRLAAFVGCPLDACPEVRLEADYVSPFKGGDGAVRDIIAFLLRLRGQWDQSVRNVFSFE